MKCKPSVLMTLATVFLVVAATQTAVWVLAVDENGVSTDTENHLIETASKLDLVATGNTYFSLERDSEEVYVRSGMLCVLSHGELALRTNEGDIPFTPYVMIPFNTRSFEVDLEGNVLIKLDGMESLVNVGQIVCNRFAAGRLLGSSLANVVTSDVPPSIGSFGAQEEAIVLSGWRSETKNKCTRN